MKKKEKIRILVLVAITIMVISIVLIMRNQKQEISKNEMAEASTITVLEDETKLNNSNQLKETKIFEGMEISSIQLTETEGEMLLVMSVTNISETKQGGYPVKIKIVDEQKKEMSTIDAYIGELQPGKNMKISTSAILDITEIYDFTITKE